MLRQGQLPGRLSCMRCTWQNIRFLISIAGKLYFQGGEGDAQESGTQVGLSLR